MSGLYKVNFSIYLSSYPLVKNNSAFAALCGVSTNPGLEEFSPKSSRMFRKLLASFGIKLAREELTEVLCCHSSLGRVSENSELN